MKNSFLVAAACAAAFSATTALAGPMDAMKGKMKAGLYETKMTMDMGSIPGMPKGMTPPPQTFQNCVTDRDIEKGTLGKKDKDNQKCEVKDFKMSGNTATYKMVCTDPEVIGENKITFTGDGHVMDMKMAMNRGGQVMNMSQRLESRYIGPCPK